MLWGFILIVYTYLHQDYGNQLVLSRLDLLHALIRKGTFRIDDYQNTYDEAFAHGHYYCDKAPGVAFLAVPSFYLSSQILRETGVPLDSGGGWLVSSWMGTACSVAPIAALGCVFFYLSLLHFVSSRWAFLATVVIAFGTMTFPYATALLSHGAVIGLISIALWTLLPQCEANPRPLTRYRPIVGGFASGLAVSCEFDAALVAASVYILFCMRGRKAACLAACGSAPPLSLIPAYNWISMGTPFSLPYAHEAVHYEMSAGLYGIHAPNVGAALILLFSQHSGLFFWTPFLFLACFGYQDLYRRSPSLCLLCYVVPIMQVVVISGNYNVSAGFTFGARYLSPIVPLLALPAGIGASKAPWLGVFSGVLSVVATTGATIVNSMLIATTGSVLDYYRSEFRRGRIPHNLGAMLGLPPHWQMAPLIAFVAIGSYLLARRLGRSHPPADSLPISEKAPMAWRTRFCERPNE